MMNSEEARAFIASRHRGVIATLKQSDGRPQLSNVVYLAEDRDDAFVIRISTTDDRAKVANLRADDRASLHVTSDDFWSYVVAECRAGLSPVASAPDDEVVDTLLEIHDHVQGKPHPEPDEFRQAMVDDRRLVLTLVLERVYPLSA